MVTTALIEKWKKMLSHKSILHVKQGKGEFFSAENQFGYYNDLRDKVRYTVNRDGEGIPFNIAAHGNEKKNIYFPVAVFQYGLGAYDLYLETREPRYHTAMIKMADWAVAYQQEEGAWDTFGSLRYVNPYSSMAQGEGASLLARAYKETGDEKYRASCERAIDFMLKPRDQGGCADYEGDKIILFEYPHKSPVLNGWIFSAFGIFDAWKITGDQKYRKTWEDTLKGIERYLPEFDAGHWSYYDMSRKYASPFYHELHIALMKALAELDGKPTWEHYIHKWTKCRDSAIRRRIAFMMKAMQKIAEKKSDEWVIIA